MLCTSLYPVYFNILVIDRKFEENLVTKISFEVVSSYTMVGILSIPTAIPDLGILKIEVGGSIYLKK